MEDEPNHRCRRWLLVIALVGSACAATESTDSPAPVSTAIAPAATTAVVPASSLSEPVRSTVELPAMGAAEEEWRAVFETTGLRPNILATSTTLVVATIRAVIAFDLRDGAERWRLPATSNGWTSALSDQLRGRELFVVLGPGEVGAVDIESGEIRWRNRVANDGICTSLGAPVVSDQQVFLARSCTFRNSAEVIALAAASGAVLWRHEIEGAEDDAITAPALVTAEMVVVRATIGARSGKHEETYVALDRRTGALRWQSTLPVHPENQMAALRSPRLVGDVIVVDEAGRSDLRRAAGLDARTGELRWRSNVAAAEVVGDIVVGSDARRKAAQESPAVLAVSASTGNELWRIDGVVQARRALNEAAPLILAADQHILGVDPRTGSTMWRAPLDPFEFSNPPLFISAQSIDDRAMVLVRTSTGVQNRSLTVVQPLDIFSGAAGRATKLDLFTLATIAIADGGAAVVGRVNRPELPSSYAGWAIALKYSMN